MAFRDSGLLTVSALRRLNLLQPFEGRREIRMGYSIFVERPKPSIFRFYVPIDADHSINFPVTDQRFWRVTDVKSSSVKLKFGNRTYFHCPVTEETCFKLVFYKGYISSKRAFSLMVAGVDSNSFTADDIETRSRLLKLGATQRWSIQTNAKILERAMRLKGRDHAVNEALALQERRLRKHEEARLWECRQASTSKALDCGRGLVGTRSIHRMYFHDEDWFAKPTPSVVLVRSSSAALLSDFGELDIRVLIERAELNGQQLTGRTLGWPTDISEGHFISMYVRPRPGEMPRLIMEIEGPDGAIRYQAIALLPAPDSTRPRYFVCPVDQARTDLLYFRNGIFASRMAHFLRYPPGGKIGLIRQLQSHSPESSSAV